MHCSIDLYIHTAVLMGTMKWGAKNLRTQNSWDVRGFEARITHLVTELPSPLLVVKIHVMSVKGVAAVVGAL